MALLASLRAACLTEGPWVQEVSGALDTFERATEALVAGAAEDPTFAGAVAADYLELAGLVLYACLWQRMVPAAVRAAEAGRVSEGFAEDKRSTGAFFMAMLLPKISLLSKPCVGKRAAHGGSALALGASRGPRRVLRGDAAHPGSPHCSCTRCDAGAPSCPRGVLGRPPKGSPPSDARSLG